MYPMYLGIFFNVNNAILDWGDANKARQVLGLWEKGARGAKGAKGAIGAQGS